MLSVHGTWQGLSRNRSGWIQQDPPCSSITIISPGMTSRMRSKPMGPNAQSSEATHHSSPCSDVLLPSTSGLTSRKPGECQGAALGQGGHGEGKGRGRATRNCRCRMVASHVTCKSSIAASIRHKVLNRLCNMCLGLSGRCMTPWPVVLHAVKGERFHLMPKGSLKATRPTPATMLMQL